MRKVVLIIIIIIIHYSDKENRVWEKAGNAFRLTKTTKDNNHYNNRRNRCYCCWFHYASRAAHTVELVRKTQMQRAFLENGCHGNGVPPNKNAGRRFFGKYSIFLHFFLLNFGRNGLFLRKGIRNVSCFLIHTFSTKLIFKHSLIRKYLIFNFLISHPDFVNLFKRNNKIEINE